MAAATSLTARVASRNIENTSGCRSSSVSTMSPNGVLWTLSDDRLRLAQRLAADGAGVFERHRIALLRHDAARLHEAVAEAHVVEFGGAPQQQILHEAAEAGQQHRRGRRALQQIIHRRDAAVGIDGRAAEAQQIRSQMAVDRETRCR